MIIQKDVSGERLAKEIRVLAESPGQLEQMEEANRKLAHGDAAASVVDMIEELSHKKHKATQSTKHLRTKR